MFGSIGFQEMLIILMVALLVFGPKKLPEVGRTIGKAIREFKRSTEEIKGKFEEQVRAEEFKSIRTDIQDIQRNLDVRSQLSDLTKEIDVTKGAAEDGEAKKES